MEASPPSNHLGKTITAGFSCFVVPLSNGNTRHYTLPLAGLLDDYLLSEGDGNLLQNEDATKDLSAATASHSLQYEDLFHSMIFSVDTRADVAMQLEKCTDSKCAEYFQTTATASAAAAQPMSNVDVLKQANAIGGSMPCPMMKKPSDFISDCREVVNLSRVDSTIRVECESEDGGR
jgi:hypothetical protein